MIRNHGFLTDVLKENFSAFKGVFSAIGDLLKTLGLFNSEAADGAKVMKVWGAIFKATTAPLRLLAKGFAFILKTVKKLIEPFSKLGGELKGFSVIFKAITVPIKLFGKALKFVAEKGVNILVKGVTFLAETLNKLVTPLVVITGRLKDFFGIVEKGNGEILTSTQEMSDKLIKIAEHRLNKEKKLYKNRDLDEAKALSEKFEKNKKINDEIFKLTHSETENKLKAIDEQAEAYREAGADEILIAKFVALEKEKINKELNDKIFKKDEKLQEKIQKLNEQALNTLFKSNEKSIEDQLQADQDLNDAELELLFKQIKKEAEIQKEAIKNELDLEAEAQKQKEDVKRQIKDAAFESAGQIVTDRINSGIDQELNSFRYAQDAKEQALKNRLDKGEITEAEFENKVSKLKAETRKKEAKAEKKKALYSIAIATAVGIAKAIPNVPLIAFAAVLGALQAAVVAARPIPAFFKGVQNFEGGEAVVGEKGRELLEMPGHVPVLSPDNATKMFLPKGTNVIPNAKTEQILKDQQNNNSNLEVIKGLKSVESAVKNQQSAPYWTQSGLTYRDEKRNLRKTHLDRKIR